MFGKIMVDSNDAVADTQDLISCRSSLFEAKQQLAQLRYDMFTLWEGNAKNVYYDALSDYIEQVDEMINRSLNAIQWIDTIITTYKDADQALVT